MNPKPWIAVLNASTEISNFDTRDLEKSANLNEQLFHEDENYICTKMYKVLHEYHVHVKCLSQNETEI